MRYILLDDEADEATRNIPTTTYVLDVSNLRNPRFVGEYRAETMAIDHNQYIVGSYSYQANNNAGLRILRIDDPEDPQNGLVEEAIFDIDIAPRMGVPGVFIPTLLFVRHCSREFSISKSPQSLGCTVCAIAIEKLWDYFVSEAYLREMDITRRPSDQHLPSLPTHGDISC